MSKHSKKNPPKQTQQALETLQESREAADSAKAELLEHNALLHPHADNDDAPVEAEDEAQEYRAEEQEEVQPAPRENACAAAANTLDMMQQNFHHLMVFQLEALSALVEAWSYALETVSKATRVSRETASDAGG